MNTGPQHLLGETRHVELPAPNPSRPGEAIPPRFYCRRRFALLAILLAASACRPAPRPPDASVHLYDLATGEKLSALRGHFYATKAIALSPDGQMALTADGARELRLWSLESRQEVLTFDPFQAPNYRGSVFEIGEVWHLQFLEGTNLLLVSHAGAGVSLWNLAEHALVRRFKAPFRATATVLASGNPGRVFATGLHEPTVACWNLNDGQLVGIFTEVRRANSPWMTLAQDGKPRSWWNIDTGEPWPEGDSEPEGELVRPFHQTVLSPDGRTLLTYYGGVENQPEVHRLQVWDLESGRLLWRRRDLTLPIIYACRSWSSCEAIAFSADSHSVAVGMVDGRVEIRDVASGRITREFQAPPRSCSRVAFLPDGRHLLTWGESTMRLWELGRGEPVRSMSVPILCCFTVTPDGRLLVVGGAGMNNQGK